MVNMHGDDLVEDFDESKYNSTLFGNITDLDQFLCVQQYHDLEENFSGCHPMHDKILCWPPTRRNSLAIQPCFKEYNGVFYSIEENATKFCNQDGVWEKSFYDICINSTSTSLNVQHDVEYNTLVYFVGYICSIIALSLAVIIFLKFKELRCLRNTIHCNLFFSYIFSALLWHMTLSFQMSPSEGALVECMILMTFFHFFNLTNFFWMMIEGLYLYLLVVETFSRVEVFNKFIIYAVIGYGVPAICALSWTVVKAIVERELLYGEGGHEIQFECPYMQESSVDWIFKGPVCLVLIINLIFLFSIMWVLITKLRSANTAETRQYRKAAKALLVLIPLFGLTYLIVLYGPTEGVEKKIFDFARAFLLSTQGFTVALFYCFFNSEVRKAIKNRINRWKDARNIQRDQLHRLETSRRKKSSDSKNEFLRPLTCNTQKRSSSATTTTILTEIPATYVNFRDSNGTLQRISPLMKQKEDSAENCV